MKRLTRTQPMLSYLKIVLLTDCVELRFVRRQFWDPYVHRRSHCCTKVGRTECEEAVLRVTGEFHLLLDHFDALLGIQLLFSVYSRRQSKEQTAAAYFGKTSVNLRQIPASLHRDNPHVIFLTNPHQKRLFVVVENTASSWPVAVSTSISEYPAK